MEKQEENRKAQIIKESQAAFSKSAFDAKGFNSLLTDPFFVSMINASPSGVTIFNNATMEHEYFSPNMENLFGYSSDKLLGLSGTEFAYKTYHSDHINTVIKLMEQVRKYYQRYAAEGRVKDTRYTFTLQFKLGNGKYIWVIMQTMVVDVNQYGFPLRSMTFISDLTDVKLNAKIDFVFSLKNKATGFYETIHASHHETNKEYRLSEREIDVLNCISQGMRNHEIADKLNISKHTVITHRKNIIK